MSALDCVRDKHELECPVSRAAARFEKSYGYFCNLYGILKEMKISVTINFYAVPVKGGILHPVSLSVVCPVSTRNSRTKRYRQTKINDKVVRATCNLRTSVEFKKSKDKVIRSHNSQIRNNDNIQRGRT